MTVKPSYEELERRVDELRKEVKKCKQVEDEHERSLSQLRATLDSTADGILVVDSDGKMVAFNKRFVKMWNIPAAIIKSRDDEQTLAFVLDQLKNPEDFLKKVRELYAHPDAKSFDTLEFRDGRIFERYSRPQMLDGKSIGRVWSFRDATESSRAKIELLESREQYRTVLEANPDPVVVYDRKGKVLYMNPAFTQVFGWTLEEQQKKKMDVFVPEDTWTETRMMIDKCRLNNKVTI